MYIFGNTVSIAKDTQVKAAKPLLGLGSYRTVLF